MLADIVREGPDEVWCLGDVVGYGAHPNECVDRTRTSAVVSLCGNHDLAAVGALDIAEFSGDAGAAVRWTQTVLGDEQAAWLRTLAPSMRHAGVDLYHGSPRDPVWEYVLSEHVARLSFLATPAPIVLVGHSHVALGLSWDGETTDGGLAPEGTDLDLARGRWLLNPGSVGQPRDGDPRAAWLLIDLDAGRATFRRTPYPIAQAQAAIRAQGLPEPLAARLAHGL